MYLYIFHSILLFIWYFFFFFLSSFCQNFLTANVQQGFPVICLCLDDFCLGFQFWVSVPLLVALVILWLWSAAVSPLIFIVYWSPVCCSVHGLFVCEAWTRGVLAQRWVFRCFYKGHGVGSAQRFSCKTGESEEEISVAFRTT